MSDIESVLTCPHCGFQMLEEITTQFCQLEYECEACHKMIETPPGECCVYCVYGSVRCASSNHSDSSSAS
ncbi:GDCCVxC domain-containing (seleno)protein [Neptuniibacter caesariensis]|uniref:GDCCVxC domain-containing (seleno)protein n=1 Tax=Neptuniibacter caesariensis TaxID=207954 RepID=UPI000A06CCCC|nr:GDCCVxC domain-containing (seleno)protein [Neptuniibacter caesariensis]